jgi:hypothetical protein
VLPAQQSVPEAWRCIAYNVSATGVGITLPFELDEGTLLTIQPWDLPGSRPLQARIVQSRQVETAWFTGCEWLQFLSEDEVEIWCSAPRDWLDEHQA